ncbi:MAG: hypothetical protein EOP48_19890 [Sphingobacteriales bacterium]|nr:MAG: hypothetical protein EOP48_19890 [Sphingobacteriales bacterium]
MKQKIDLDTCEACVLNVGNIFVGKEIIELSQILFSKDRCEAWFHLRVTEGRRRNNQRITVRLIEPIDKKESWITEAIKLNLCDSLNQQLNCKLLGLDFWIVAKF